MHKRTIHDTHASSTDLTTRHGLKKIHARFNDYHKRLDAAYTSARRCGNEKVMGGVVGIMAKMCADAILRDKLFQKGRCLAPFISNMSLISVLQVY